MRRGLTVRMIVADAVLATVVGTTFAFLLLAIAEPPSVPHSASPGRSSSFSSSPAT
jgi:hypothetical protein